MANDEMVVYESNQLATSGNLGDGFYCTVDLSTEEGQNVALVALNGATPLKELGDKPFLMKDIIQEPGMRAVSNTPCVNTYIISDNNKVYFTQSDGIAKSVIRFAKVKKDKFHGGPGVMVQVGEQPTRNGTMKYIIPAKS